MASGKKIRTFFACSACGSTFAKWSGQCPECGQWNSLQEERSRPPSRRAGGKSDRANPPTPLAEVPATGARCISTGIGELDDVLGGGLVSGGVTMIAGDPGIGKSTLLLQVADLLATAGRPVLYVSGEESLPQIKRRAERLRVTSPDLVVLAETEWPGIEHSLRRVKPQVLIIDSIQTTRHPDWPSPPGTVGQIRESAQAIIEYCKLSGTIGFLIGHVTKEGAIAGPKVLEHMVDTVLYFEGERHQAHRIIRSVKNRFGPTNEIGVFQMTEKGLEAVTDPSGLFLAERPENAAGSVVGCAIEGRRPFLLEVQALVTPTHYGSPQRVCTGVDPRRLVLAIAILEKICGLGLGARDVFANIAGGFRSSEPALDLAVCAAIISGYEEAPVPPDMVVFGEVGLAGEIRAVPRLETRLKEAKKMGFTRAVVPAGNAKQLEYDGNIEIMAISTLTGINRILFH
jgi:DNA repair protein RadA/Sms